jgi:LCP family protein required for cell wall assembly
MWPVPAPIDPDDRPRYTRHRAGPGFLGRRRGRSGDDDLAALNALRAREQELDRGAGGRPRAGASPTPPVVPEARRDEEGRVVYRAGSSSRTGGRRRGGPRLPRPGIPGRRLVRLGGALTAGYVLKLLLKAAVAWLVISFVAFVISATIHQSGSAGGALGGGGLPPFGTTTILVLGSDARPKSSKEPGAGGPSRSDTMLLMRVGGGVNTRLSIPRDTVVDIPGHGRGKINGAYAYGGAALAVKTVERFMGIQVNHLIEVNFQNFPDLIDAMGGVTYTGGCVVSRINGGFRNGGYTLRLKSGTSTIDGKQALALARTRKNLCNRREDDTTRARRQQKLLSSMKSRVLSPSGFIRGPFIGWNVPQAIKSDMSAPTLFGVFAALSTAGTATPQVLKATPVTLPGGELALSVSDGQRIAARRRFLGK